jgi:nitrogen fixation/metabolism regulation signal transduction histidine kinase
LAIHGPPERHSIPSSQHLVSLTYGSLHLPKDRVWRTGRKGVRITVADSGHGMSKDTLARIFELFFSTKGITGAGLGLWVKLGIIQKHEGRMKVSAAAKIPATMGRYSACSFRIGSSR